MKNSTAVETSWGIFVARWSDGGLSGLDFPGRWRGDYPRADASCKNEASISLAEDIEQYIGGRPVQWRTALDFGAATAFQHRVWQTIASIPFGEVRSYAWLAENADHSGAVRAAANACGANPLPILIPCHRVIASSGGFGGFSAGIRWKKRLLSLEQQSMTSIYEPFRLESHTATLRRYFH